ncbi:MAG: GntR family transcriptional regulator [Arenibacterium sp.]
MQPPSIEPSAPDARPAPRYIAIEQTLKSAIEQGRLADGTILTEGPIADLFGTSRTQVRTALAQLETAGMITRFDGRGFLVARDNTTPTPNRISLTRAMLGLSQSPAKEPQPASAERLVRAFQETLALALPFGQFRINEQAAADHFNVSRNVVRELLSRFQDRGLVGKDSRSHWIVGPLTARDLQQFFAIRGKLEPLALIDSAPKIPRAELVKMRDRLDAVTRGDRTLDTEQLDQLETDMHVRLLAHSPNTYLLRMIRQTQSALVVNRVFASFVGTQPFDLALGEHAIVMDFLIRDAHSAAALSLEEHLKLSAERTRQRLMAISVFPEPDLPAYLQKQGH